MRRLLKALRHEVPGPEATAARLGLAAEKTDNVAQVFKTYHMPHTGKLSLARIFAGKLSEGANLSGVRVGGVARLKGHEMAKLPNAGLGEVVALQRMEDVDDRPPALEFGQGDDGGSLAGAAGAAVLAGPRCRPIAMTR